MCGICCVVTIQRAGMESEEVCLEKTKTYENICRRGPDCSKTIRKVLHTGNSCQISGIFYGAVLHQRGKLTSQPLEDGGNILQWNGEIFGGIEVQPSENDGLVLFSLLSTCTTDTDILSVLSRIHGPWSLVYWQESRKRLWFGRDVFGRRSLLWQRQGSALIVSSVASRPKTASSSQDWEEVPAHGIYCLPMVKFNTKPPVPSSVEIVLFPWQPAENTPSPSTNSQLIGSISSGISGITCIEETDKSENSLDTKDMTANIQACRGMMASPWRIQKSVLGICSPIVPLNKDVSGQRGSAKWQRSMGLTHDLDKTGAGDLYAVLDQLGRKESASVDGIGSDQKSYVNSHGQIQQLEPVASDLNNQDLLSDLEAQLHEHAQNLIEVLGVAVCKRVHNLARSPQLVAAKNNERTEADTENTSYNKQTNCVGADLLNRDIKSKDCRSTRTNQNSASKLLIQGEIPFTPAVSTPDVGDMGDLSHFIYSSPANLASQDQLQLDSCKPQTDRHTWESSQLTRSSISHYGNHTCCRVAILFSGGIDSMVLALLADRYIPVDESIDLLNVAFQQQVKGANDTVKNLKRRNIAAKTGHLNQDIQYTYEVPDRITGGCGLEELKKINPKRQWNFVEPASIARSYSPENQNMSPNGQLFLLELATITQNVKQCRVSEDLADKLVNVTLDELRQMRDDHVSDLLYPLQSVLDDSIGCAIWFAARGRGHLLTNTGHIDHQETNTAHQLTSKGHLDLQETGELSHPVSSSEQLDPLLTCGEHLDQQVASRGQLDHGEATSKSLDENGLYTSPAKVVLVGMGADEQLAGYSRHRAKFKASGLEGLVEEIEMEVQRISSRNLGRDDRIISDHGRESRLPYLDENVVNFLQRLPVWIKTDLSLPRGVGEKLLLRVAARMLGLTASASLPKRAIQFGSRIAKMEKSSEKATDVCSRLK